MATGTVLKLQFDTMSGSKTWSFKYAKPNAGLQTVKTLAQTMITNGSIYETPPVVCRDIREVTTNETVYDISD